MSEIGEETGYWQVVTLTALSGLEEIEDLLGDLPLSTSVFRADDGRWRVEAIVEARPDDWPLPGETTMEPLIQQDWVAQSQAALPAIRIGRFHIRGGWDAPPPVGIIDLVIEAGQAFGTGRHESTTGCLVMLQRIARRRNVRQVLDVGTGAGILAICAARLTNARAVGTDIDAKSIDVARENAWLNDAGHLCGFEHADGVRHGLVVRNRPYDLVFANILARPLVAMAADVAREVAPDGDLVLAGLLTRQVPMIMARYRLEGLQLAEEWRSNGWSVLRLHRPGGVT
ncbi:MAG: 50S ribosomal protein L11 methyltransferase [Minwuia sp.]|uniref:50S ribosomal protein L11 methyltransferase n=1 Tax=Minwuia sp. TaxID=2493630 RepID=UPI003A8B9B76